MKHLEELISVYYGEVSLGKTGGTASEDPFWDLGLAEGHRGWIPSSCYLAQTAAATLSCRRCGEVSFRRTRPDLSRSTCWNSSAAAHPHQVACNQNFG